MEIRNDNQLVEVTRNILQEAVYSVASFILSEIEYYVQHNVYGSGNVPNTYTRTNEFLNSWTIEMSSKKNSKTVAAKIFSDARKMSYDPQKGIHGSKKYGDLREEMAQIIEEGTKYVYPYKRRDGTINPAAKKRTFFKDVIAELNRNQTLLNWLEIEMQARGMPITRK